MTRCVCVLLCLFVVGVLSSGGCANRSPGVIHHVEAGENLYRIGLRYGVDAKTIARANGIRDGRSIRVGQRLFIPGVGRRTPSRQTASTTSRPLDARTQQSAGLPPHADSGSLRFVWPVRGRLSSGFGRRGGRPHDGIDIAARRGTPIYAAEAGRVIHSGRMGGYGNVVIVKHAGSFRSIYAHASRILVRKGDFVERGQKIALVGSTGRSTGPHVHFEIRQQERPRNPIAFLPR